LKAGGGNRTRIFSLEG